MAVECLTACGDTRRFANEGQCGHVTWHQFRHIHSSLLNDLNVPVKIALEKLEHASIATTLNIYTHAVDASHRKAIEAVERELFIVLDHSGPQTAAGVESAPPASNSVN
jgi:integrase